MFLVRPVCFLRKSFAKAKFENMKYFELDNYKLIDSGLGKKLEEIAGLRVVRPCPQAIWFPSVAKEEWSKAQAICHRKKDGGGTWEFKLGNDRSVLEKLYFKQNILNKKLKLKLKLTSFGHCGVFFEHVQVWQDLLEKIEKSTNKKLNILNLFGYTGGLSCALANMGHNVDHVDSARGVLDWGKENQNLNNIKDESIKWIQEDALRFVKRAEKDGKKYDGIIADPPSWGHGAKKEKWIYDEQIAQFSETCTKILKNNSSFFFLSGHTHGIQSGCLRNLLLPCKLFSEVEAADLSIMHQDQKRELPSGMYTFGHSFK